MTATTASTSPLIGTAPKLRDTLREYFRHPGLATERYSSRFC